MKLLVDSNFKVWRSLSEWKLPSGDRVKYWSEKTKVIQWGNVSDCFISTLISEVIAERLEGNIHLGHQKYPVLFILSWAICKYESFVLEYQNKWGFFEFRVM